MADTIITPQQRDHWECEHPVASGEVAPGAKRGPRHEQEGQDQHHHPHHLEEALARVLRRREPGARLEKAFATEEPAELRHDIECEQDVQGPERRGDVEVSEREWQRVGSACACDVARQCGACPPCHDPREEADEHDVRGERAEIDFGKRDDAGEHRIRAAEQGAEDEEQRERDEQPAHDRPQPAADLPSRGRGGGVSQREWHDADRDGTDHLRPRPRRVSQPLGEQRDADVGDGDGRHGEREEHGEEIERLKCVGGAPRHGGPKDHGDDQPAAGLAVQRAPVAPHERDGAERQEQQPHRETDPHEPVAQQEIRRDPEQRGLGQDGAGQRGDARGRLVRRDAGVHDGGGGQGLGGIEGRHGKNFTLQSEYAQACIVP
jgi:hypothetical protein